ncbi:MAG: DUF5946 family protein [Isosphaeraceae bacterium]
MGIAHDAYDELYVYALGRGGFILQHVVDASAAQAATEDTNPMSLIFALVGLLLRVEKRYPGKHVQEVHMKLARQRKQWPRILLPMDRGTVAAADVLAVAAGPDRDLAIDIWCQSVWAAFRGNHQVIGDLLTENKII